MNCTKCACTSVAAPEVQTQSTVSAASDMFSLGLVVAAIFNRGRPLIQANHSNPNYTKQMEMVIYIPSRLLYTLSIDNI